MKPDSTPETREVAGTNACGASIQLVACGGAESVAALAVGASSHPGEVQLHRRGRLGRVHELEVNPAGAGGTRGRHDRGEGCSEHLLLGRRESQRLAEERHHVFLEPHRHVAGVRAGIDRERVGDPVSIQHFVQLAGIDPQPVLIGDGQRNRAVAAKARDVLIDGEKAIRKGNDPEAILAKNLTQVLARQHEQCPPPGGKVPASRRAGRGCGRRVSPGSEPDNASRPSAVVHPPCTGLLISTLCVELCRATRHDLETSYRRRLSAGRAAGRAGRAAGTPRR